MKEEISLKDLKFEFNLKDADYCLDALQNKLLQFYLRADTKFRKAFNTNFTQEFLQFIRDKARMNEPLNLSILGATRGGKSYTSISLCAFHQACYNRKFSIEYVCANAYEFLEKLKIMPEDKLLNRIFLIDEEKQAVFSVGSIARKIKLEDVQNIIAINNISTIMLNPYSWANKNSNYGIRLFGRCFKTKTCRCMLYNLQAGGKGGETPMGILFLPIFTAFLLQEYSEPLEKEYLKKKMDWVRLEQKGEGDVLAEIRKKSAETFMRDKNYLGLTKKNARIEYIQFKMGSEWTRGEILSIYELTKLMEGGFI
jgi:hypothetical protein